MKKIITVIGARPQFIKAAALSRQFLNHNILEETIVHTGQHFDDKMSEIFFREMKIPQPVYNLNINGLSHGAMTGQMIEGIEKILLKEKPEYVLVYGDTNSTLAGALAATKLHIKVIHVEAGLRSFNMQMPEEVNRVLTDRIATLLFCPTKQAVLNLNNEGFANFDCSIYLSGDVMQDSALLFSKHAEEKSTILDQLAIQDEGYLLCTLHRAENTDNIENLKQILSALNDLHAQYPIVLPLHPRTKKIIEENNLEISFQPIGPLGYLDMLKLIKHSRLILTDSGGLQKEAYFFSKYCVTMRDQTEWTELVDIDVNRLTGANTESIVHTVTNFINKPSFSTSDLYGSGKASENICKCIIDHLS
jgi:UDP-GlcNAc3NAcA epimerase